MKDKFGELLDLGLELVREGGVFGLVTPSYARRMAGSAFIAGAIVGGVGTALLLLRNNGQLSETLHERIEEIRQTLMRQFGQPGAEPGAKPEPGARVS